MIRLFINGQELDLAEDVIFPLTFSQADAKNPEQRKRSSSKTIVLPGTNNNNRFYLSAYNLKASDVYGDLIGFDFDPTLRYPFFAERNGKPIFEGSAHLTKVTRQKYEEHGMVNNFHTVLYSEIVDMFQALGDIKVSELGWAEYDHVLSVANIQASWTASTGSGYWYPLIDYGLSSDPLSVLTNQLRPHVYVKEIAEKCFKHTGRTLTGGFFNSALYKKIVWGYGGGEPILLSSSEISQRRSKYEMDGTKTYNIAFTYITVFVMSTKFEAVYFAPIGDIAFITATLVTDPLTQFNASSGEIVVAYSGSYSLGLTGTFPISYTYSNPSFAGQEYNIEVSLIIYVNGAVVNTFSESITDTAPNTQSVSFAVSQALDLNSGDTVSSYVKINTFGSKIAANGVFATLDIDFDLDNSLVMDFTAVNSGLVDGDTVEVARFLPEMKASDFLKDIILMFNHYMSDPDVDGKITLLPESQYFYETDDVDQWSDKLARDNSVEIMPAANIEGKRYRFRFAEDRDYYKQLYFEKFGVDYGDFDYNVPSTYKTGDKIYQLGTAQSVPVQIEGTDIIIPRIIQVDTATLVTRPHKGKPRMYFNNGVISSDDWYLVNSDTGAVTTNTGYPQAHHLDSLTSPTFDLNFGTPREVFYVATDYTTDNLFYRFYAQFIRQLTGRDSKVLNAWFRLDENDFYKNFMRRLCNVDGVLYRKNIIKDWIANTNSLVKVELIKIVEGRSRSNYQVAAPQTFEPPMSPVTNPTGTTSVITSNQEAHSYRLLYPVNTSSGSVSINLNADNLRKGWTGEFVKLSASNSLFITASGGGGSATISGSQSQTLTSQYSHIKVRFDGSNFYIV